MTDGRSPPQFAEVGIAMLPYLVRKVHALRERVLEPEQARLESMVGPPGAWQATARFQLAFLRRMGLRPSHRVLDIGCGPLRGGLPLIRYLDRGRYTGIEVRGEALAEAAER